MTLTTWSEWPSEKDDTVWSKRRVTLTEWLRWPSRKANTDPNVLYWRWRRSTWLQNDTNYIIWVTFREGWYSLIKKKGDANGMNEVTFKEGWHWSNCPSLTLIEWSTWLQDDNNCMIWVTLRERWHSQIQKEDDSDLMVLVTIREGLHWSKQSSLKGDTDWMIHKSQEG